MEAIGLVLNITPLLIDLLKDYPQPVDTLEGEFHRNLHFEIVMLRRALLRLVNDLPIDTPWKENLINERRLDVAVWRNPPEDLSFALKRRLSFYFDEFMHSMGKILKLLGKVVDDRNPPHILVEDNIDSTNSSYARLGDWFDAHLTMSRSLRFGWKKDKRDRITQSFAKYNRRLESILLNTAESNKAYVQPKRASTGSCTPPLGLLQKMNDLRKAIARIWCSCLGKHEIRFDLNKTWKTSDQVQLDMIMNLSKDHTRWHWGESKLSIHLQEEEEPLPRDNQRKGRSFTGNTLVGSPEVASRRESQDHALRHASVSTIAVDEVFDEPEESPVSPHGKNILDKDFCKVIQSAQRARTAIHLTFYQDTISHNSKTAGMDIPQSDLTHPGECLRSCLESGKLTMKDRKILQVLIAQSVLFFPWNGQQLNKSSILFHTNLSNPFATFLPDHDDEETDVFANGQELEEGDFKPYNNEILAALATTLLEIELQKPIESLQNDLEKEDTENVTNPLITNYWTATRVLEEHKFNMFKDSYAAIDACLRCDFGDDRPSLEDPEVLQVVYDQIVAPLERELERGFEVRLPYIGEGLETPEKVSRKAKPANLPVRKAKSQKTVKMFEEMSSSVPKELEIEKPRKAVTIAPQMTFVS